MVLQKLIAALRNKNQAFPTRACCPWQTKLVDKKPCTARGETHKLHVCPDNTFLGLFTFLNHNHVDPRGGAQNHGKTGSNTWLNGRTMTCPSIPQTKIPVTEKFLETPLHAPYAPKEETMPSVMTAYTLAQTLSNKIWLPPGPARPTD